MTEVHTDAGVDKLKPKYIAIQQIHGGVDLSDRKIYHVSTEHPSKRYWKKLYYTFLTSTNMVKSDCFLWTGIRLTAIHSGVCILSNYN